MTKQEMKRTLAYVHASDPTWFPDWYIITGPDDE